MTDHSDFAQDLHELAVRTAARFRLGGADQDDLRQQVAYKILRALAADARLEDRFASRQTRRSFIHRSLRNEAVTLVRKRAREPRCEGQVEESSSQARQTHTEQIRQAIEAVRPSLSVRGRVALLIVTQELDIHRAAELSGRSTRTIHRWFVKGIAELRNALSQRLDL